MAVQKKLIKGYSPQSISKNISYEMTRRDRPQAQAVAIALNTARDAAAAAGKTALVKKYTLKKK